ncbi:MAG: protein translocase subunit SecD [Betaproteobacteria bacterium]|nr:protein translocase subunit SecD [Betaproteobacteria bacterium]
MFKRIRQALSQAGVQERGMFVENHSIRVRLADTDQQLKAKDALQRSLNPDAADPGYVVALNLLSASPRWLSQLRALPMYLGLDLRGGVHFLLQVDLKQAAIKRYDAMAGDARSLLRDKAIRHAGISREGETIRVNFRDAETRIKSLTVLRESLTDVDWTESGEGDALALSGKLKPEAEKRAMENALKQNIITLNNRINELGVAEPIIAQQGSERVVVQLPGVQDTAKAKDILGRTATLEIRMVCDAPEEISALSAGTVPFGCERYLERGSAPVSVRKQVILTGDNLTDAQAGFDSNSQEPAVHLSLDAKGARIFRDITRENVGRRMAILLVEKGKGEVVTAPVIRSEIGGGRVQISGRMTTEEANDVALLLRAGSLAAPMEIIEERTIGPSLGAENISKGFHSTIWGFVAVTAFMALYYMLFGVISSLALATNLLLLIAVLSLLQATLTLPGIAAIALTLGMAIDANVLINERIREELRNGASPQAAISAGYDRAWDTILDSNITTLIAGIALLVFGSGPVRGFAVVHCLGILTSMFSAVFFSRGLVAAWYGSRRKLAKLSIG